MKCGCMEYDVEFWDLVEVHDDVKGDSLEGMVDLVLAEHSYNMRDKCSMDSFLHNTLKAEGMSDFVLLAHQAMDAGAQKTCFCS